MNGQRRFLLDTNVFIEAHRHYYAFDICPGFWECLSLYHDRILSIDSVRKELEDKSKDQKDELWKWIKSELPRTFFIPNDNSRVMKHYSEIVQWVMANRQYFPQAKQEFAEVADSWLIAHAMADGFVLVTHETSEPTRQNRVKIPNVCEQFNVEYANTFEMLRELEEQFVRDARYRQ